MKPHLKVTTYSVTKKKSQQIQKIGINPVQDHHGLKLESNNNTNYRKPTNSWKPNNAQMNHPWLKDNENKEIKDFLGFIENECITYPNLYGTMKAVL